MTPDALIGAARGWLDVPWRHLGRTRAGVDCIGLVILAAAEAGMQIADPAPYARQPQETALLRGVLAHGARVAVPQPGDVLVFRMGAVFGGHVGIATSHHTYGVPAVLHAFATHRKVVEQPMNADLTRALLAVVRVTGA
jgi:cell wall-associated NlpC family hydrolase